MSLIETLISSILISMFFSIFVSAFTPVVKMKNERIKIEKEYYRDVFISKSFGNENFEDWKNVINAFYPDEKISIEKIGTKDSFSLYKISWGEKKSYLLKKEL